MYKDICRTNLSESTAIIIYACFLSHLGYYTLDMKGSLTDYEVLGELVKYVVS